MAQPTISHTTSSGTILNFWDEEWKSLECLGFPKHKVSNMGVVYSTIRNYTLKQTDDGKGYMRICLSKPGS